MPASTDRSDISKWEELTAEVRRDRRREQRINLAYPIQVYGFDRNGRYFAEQTVTQNVSPGGCRFELKREPEIQGVLAIRLVTREGARSPEHKPVLFLVCWVERSGRRWAVGVSKLQATEVWGLAMPPGANTSAAPAGN
jgi:hypothetical protein